VYHLWMAGACLRTSTTSVDVFNALSKSAH
jgi:hypothetical protein